MVTKKRKKSSSGYEPLSTKVYHRGKGLYIKDKLKKGKYLKIGRIV